MSEENVQDDDNEQISMSFRVPSKMPSVLAQHLFVQPLGEFVQLSFFEIVYLPTNPNYSKDENIKRLKETGIVAECVSRINIPASHYKNFVKAMQQVVIDDVSNEDKSQDLG